LGRDIEQGGDLALVDEIFATNYVGNGPGGHEVKGSEGFKQLFTMYLINAFPGLHFTIEDMVAKGDKVMCCVKGQGKDNTTRAE